MKYLDYIDDYFKGEYSEAKTRQFEDRLETDPLFAEEVAFYLSAMQVLRQEARAEKTNRFRAIYEEKHPPVRTAGSYVRILYIAVAAVFVCGLLLAAWLFMKPTASKQQMADTFINDHLTQLGVPMSAGKEDSVKIAKDYYNSKAFPQALSYFEPLATSHTEDGSLLEYAGITCLRLGQYDKALEYFDKRAKQDVRNNPALFYQALAYMKRNKEGDMDKAKAILQQVASNGPSDKKDIAQSWLDKW